MAAGFPDGTPLRRGVTFAYYHVESIQFLRTTYKAGPLLALGHRVPRRRGARGAVDTGRSRRPRPPGRVARGGGRRRRGPRGARGVAARQRPRPGAPARVLGAAVLARRRARPRPPRPDDTRALVEPGQLFAYYRWGGTIDAILPALTKHPVATRWIVPFADLRSADLQWTVDDLIGQERLRPGQLAPLLDLMGVGDLVVAADGDRSRSGRGAARATWRALLGSGPAGRGLRPDRAGGARRRDDRAGAAACPRCGGSRSAPAGSCACCRAAPLTVVDGGAGGLAGLAAYGALDADRPIAYAADLGPAAALRAAARDGASVRDRRPDRRRAFAASQPRGRPRPGPRRRTAGRGVDGALLDPFGREPGAPRPSRSCAACARVTADASPQTTQFPERRPFAALDGDPRTAWLADRALVPSRHALDVAFTGRRDVPYVDLHAVLGQPGRRARGRDRRPPVRRPPRLEPAAGAACATRPRSPCGCRASAARGARREGAGGIRELRIPGVRVTEALRPPTVIESALRGADLRANPLTYLFERDTADVAGPARALRRRARGGRAPRRAGPRAPAAARLRPARRAPLRGRRVGERRPAHARRDARRAGGHARGGHGRLVGALRERAALPRLGRVRRHARAGLDRAVDRRAAGVAVVAHPRAARPSGGSSSSRPPSGCGARRACG